MNAEQEDKIIHVGDEIYDTLDTFDSEIIKGVVLRKGNLAGERNYLYIMWDDGSCGEVKPQHQATITKTGRHFPQIEEVLKKLQEDSKNE